MRQASGWGQRSAAARSRAQDQVSISAPRGSGHGAGEAPGISTKTNAQDQAAADLRAMVVVFMGHLLRIVDRVETKRLPSR